MMHVTLERLTAIHFNDFLGSREVVHDRVRIFCFGWPTRTSITRLGRRPTVLGSC